MEAHGFNDDLELESEIANHNATNTLVHNIDDEVHVEHDHNL